MVDDPACLGAVEPGSPGFFTREGLKALLAGVVMLSILALSGKRYLDRRATAIAAHIERLRAVHAVEEGMSEVRKGFTALGCSCCCHCQCFECPVVHGERC